MNIIRTGKITIKDSNVGEPFTSFMIHIGSDWGYEEVVTIEKV